MHYTGVIIEESLQDTSVFQEVNILETKIEPVTPKHKTPWLKQWTLRTVEIPEEKAQEVAENIRQSFDQQHAAHWFADYKNDTHHVIIFADNIYTVDLANPTGYTDAKAHAVALGIPEYQIGFVPPNS